MATTNDTGKIELGLERIRHLLHLLGNPQDKLNVIHVAGTNGKGSVCAYIASILSKAGYKVGRFNSPHLIHPRDSIKIGDEPLSVEEYEHTQSRVEAIDASSISSSDSAEAPAPQVASRCSTFEVLTATALYHFAFISKVDVAVIEVGLGGRLDATNVFNSPLVTVITAIGLDHVEFLGDTVKKIALEKAGIMKDGIPAVISPQEYSSASAVLVERAQQLHAPGYKVEAAKLVPEDRSDQGEPGVTPPPPRYAEVSYCGHRCVFPVMLEGEYQLGNVATAIKAVEVMRELPKTPGCSEGRPRPEHIIEGLRAVKWPARLDWICLDSTKDDASSVDIPKSRQQQREQWILVDGAHNEAAARALAQYVDKQRRRVAVASGDPSLPLPQIPVHWIFGATRGKDVQKILSVLLRDGDILTAVGFSQPEGMPWISCTPSSAIVDAAERTCSNLTCHMENRVEQILQGLQQGQYGGEVRSGLVVI
ncbi:hypothetical protein HK102_013334, partial [Quaeritorhiza haematococci]